MKILLEMCINEGEERRITLIESTIDSEQDAISAYDAIKGFDCMVDGSGYFNDNDHICLEINGESIGYEQIAIWQDLVEFLGGWVK